MHMKALENILEEKAMLLKRDEIELKRAVSAVSKAHQRVKDRQKEVDVLKFAIHKMKEGGK